MDPVSQAYKTKYLNGLVADEPRGTCAFQIDEDLYPIEELIAMQLAHAKRQAETHGGDAVYGAVITVSQIFNIVLIL